MVNAHIFFVPMRVSKSWLCSEAAYDLGSGGQDQLNKEDTGDVLVSKQEDAGHTTGLSPISLKDSKWSSVPKKS